MEVPFFRVVLGEHAAAEVADCLRSGWLTTGRRVYQFECDYRRALEAKNALAVNSCTAALHLAVDALGLQPGMAVLVPTMTFAASAEVLRYQGAVPVLVDCKSETLNIDLEDAERKLQKLIDGELAIDSRPSPRGIIPVHVGGSMIDMQEVQEFARRQGLWVVEDAAHAFPAAFRETDQDSWQKAGQNTADVTCFSFYANKTITTGEGGMAVTDHDELAERMRTMSLHGLSHDAWNRFETGASWDYKIIAPGYKYNMTDVAAAIGIHQLAKSEQMRKAREAVASFYLERLAAVEEIELPTVLPNRVHSWHLFAIRLHLEKLSIDRNTCIEHLNQRGVGTSVHWRPLHMHPYYKNTYGWKESDFPVASREWRRLISLPIFPDMRHDEMEYVADQVRAICEEFAQPPAS